jgi:hypothetical protein
VTRPAESAQELRRSSQLWPECLTDRELEEELQNAMDLDQPISLRMLKAELARRGLAQPRRGSPTSK